MLLRAMWRTAERSDSLGPGSEGAELHVTQMLTSSSRLISCSNCCSSSGGRPAWRRLTLMRCQSNLKCSRCSAWLAKALDSASRPHATQPAAFGAEDASESAAGCSGCAAAAGVDVLRSHVMPRS